MSHFFCPMISSFSQYAFYPGEVSLMTKDLSQFKNLKSLKLYIRHPLLNCEKKNS